MFHIPFTYLFTSDFTRFTQRIFRNHEAVVAYFNTLKLDVSDARSGETLLRWNGGNFRCLRHRRWWQVSGLKTLFDNRQTDIQQYKISLVCFRHSWVVTTRVMVGYGPWYGWNLLIPLLRSLSRTLFRLLDSTSATGSRQELLKGNKIFQNFPIAMNMNIPRNLPRNAHDYCIGFVCSLFLPKIFPVYLFPDFSRWMNAYPRWWFQTVSKSCFPALCDQTVQFDKHVSTGCFKHKLIEWYFTSLGVSITMDTSPPCHTPQKGQSKKIEGKFGGKFWMAIRLGVIPSFTTTVNLMICLCFLVVGGNLPTFKESTICMGWKLQPKLAYIEASKPNTFNI